ncbi:MAG: hypothetical protein AB7E29_12540 [Xanthobacter sp.]
MADYYPLLVRAISSLPQNSAEARRAVFDRARAALLKQLRSVSPPLPEGEITRERLSLEEAIRRIEADLAAQDNDTPDEDLSADAAGDESGAEQSSGGNMAGAGAYAPPAGQGAATDDSHDDAPAAPSETDGAAGDEGAEAAPPEVQRADAATTGAATGPLPRGQVRSRDAAREAGLRPGLKRAEKPASSWKKPALWALLVVVALIIIGLVFVNRSAVLDHEPQTATAPATTQAQPDRPKNADRMASAADDAARRAPDSARQQAAGTQRAVLLEESPGGNTPPQSFEGTVTWKTETFEAGPGLPPELGVRGVVTVPERQISMEFVLRRNMDQTLPASHTIELSFDLPKDFAFGPIASIPGIRMKPTQQAQGVPLAGLSVRVNPTLFLVGLSTVPAERQRNVTLMQLYPWIDVPFVYENNKRAVILFDKGTTGEQAFHEAFASWGELVERTPEPPPAQQ